MDPELPHLFELLVQLLRRVFSEFLPFLLNMLSANIALVFALLVCAILGLLLWRHDLSLERERRRQAKSLLWDGKALLQTGRTNAAHVRFNIAQRLWPEVVRSLPPVEERSLMQQIAKRHRDPQLWFLLTRHQIPAKASQLTEVNGGIRTDEPQENAATRSVNMLEGHANEPGFFVRWKAFEHACSLLVPGLPVQAREWIATADEYEMGRLSLEELIAARVQAWEFYDSQETRKSPIELSRLRIAMSGLWPPYDLEWNWDLYAWSFFEDCELAGIPESQWWPLLQAQYPHILGQPRA